MAYKTGEPRLKLVLVPKLNTILSTTTVPECVLRALCRGEEEVVKLVLDTRL